jgi:hypothetical protein
MPDFLFKYAAKIKSFLWVFQRFMVCPRSEPVVGIIEKPLNY